MGIKKDAALSALIVLLISSSTSSYPLQNSRSLISTSSISIEGNEFVELSFPDIADTVEISSSASGRRNDRVKDKFFVYKLKCDELDNRKKEMNMKTIATSVKVNPKQRKYILDKYLYMVKGDINTLVYRISLYPSGAHALIVVYNDSKSFEEYLENGKTDDSIHIRLIKDKKVVEFTNFAQYSSGYYFVAVELIDESVEMFTYERQGKRLAYDVTDMSVSCQSTSGLCSLAVKKEDCLLAYVPHVVDDHDQNLRYDTKRLDTIDNTIEVYVSSYNLKGPRPGRLLQMLSNVNMYGAVLGLIFLVPVALFVKLYKKCKRRNTINTKGLLDEKPDPITCNADTHGTTGGWAGEDFSPMSETKIAIDNSDIDGALRDNTSNNDGTSGGPINNDSISDDVGTSGDVAKCSQAVVLYHQTTPEHGYLSMILISADYIASTVLPSHRGNSCQRSLNVYCYREHIVPMILNGNESSTASSTVALMDTHQSPYCILQGCDMLRLLQLKCIGLLPSIATVDIVRHGSMILRKDFKRNRGIEVDGLLTGHPSTIRSVLKDIKSREGKPSSNTLYISPCTPYIEQLRHNDCRSDVPQDCNLTVMRNEQLIVSHPATDNDQSYILSDKVLDSEPDLTIFLSEVILKTRHMWCEFGTMLKLERSFIKNLIQEYPNSRLRFIAVFDEWRDTCSLPFTWRTIIDTLRELDQNHVANNLEKHLLSLSAEDDITTSDSE